ncbi:MAG: hypothetical protein HY231_18430 [Acidobacteria bacterium]|nr:hypothetical protein [Acidobacteriota bacterium]
MFGAQNSLLPLAMAAATVVLLLGCSWLIFESVRLRNQLGQAEAARLQKANEAAAQIAAQRSQNQQLANDLERERLEREQLEQELAQEKARHEKAASASGGFGVLAAFLLSAGLVRDAQGAKRLVIPASAQQVRLQLKLRRTVDYPSYRAALKTIDGVALVQTAARKSGKAVVVNFSSRQLQVGDYRLTLSGINTTGSVEEIDSYYFSVVKK